MSRCEDDHCKCTRTTASQSLDEMDFERGIWYAAQYGDLDRVKKLLGGYGSDVDARDSAGYTALHYAARNGHLDTCRFLVDRGADVDAVTRAGKATALSRAALAGKHEVVEYLLSKKADPFVADVDGRTALHRAAENGHLAICEVLLKAAPSLGELTDNRGAKADLAVD